jgi:hypothetical protein
MHPQYIQLAILAAAFYLPALGLVAYYMFRKLEVQQRLRDIERGADPRADPHAAAGRTRRAGIVCIAAGLGLSVANVIVVVAAASLQALVFQAVAVVPFAIGLGLLVDYRIARRELAEGPRASSGRSELEAGR